MTENAKHTPAPWHINGHNLCEVIVIREGADKDGHTYTDGKHQERIAMVGTDNSATWSERHANARLIAASPIMHDGIKIAATSIDNIMDKFEAGTPIWRDLQKIMFGLINSLPEKRSAA